MGKRLGFVVLIVLSVAALALAGCGQAKLGTEKNPIIMSFVPSGDTQEIIASGDQLAEMMSEITGLMVQAEVGTDFAATREAMGAGKAIVAARANALAEGIIDGQTGLLYDEGDAAELAERLYALATAPDLRRRLGTNARARVDADYSTSAIAQRMRQIYEV